MVTDSGGAGGGGTMVVSATIEMWPFENVKVCSSGSKVNEVGFAIGASCQVTILAGRGLDHRCGKLSRRLNAAVVAEFP
jgi:hypothetical protein